MGTWAGSPTSAARFRVLRNEADRHAIWPEHRGMPPGWREVIGPKSRAECLDYVREHWRDLDAPGRRPIATTTATATARRVGFGIMFFGGGEQDAAGEKYRLLFECARFADARGLDAVWLPERHFTRIGCLYPNPAILHAALARETTRVRLRAGSVVLPLHDPIRVAEEWAVVDNLSGGRVEVSFAPGWNPADFAFFPDRYEDRHDRMYRALETVHRLWRGETIASTGGDGRPIEVRTYPTPIQADLPTWITVAGDPRSFRKAGASGANLLTHLFDQGIEALAAGIAAYRESRSGAGFDPAAGRVAVALHTCIADDPAEVRRRARGPFLAYLKSNVKLVEKLAQSRGLDLDLTTLTPEQVDQTLEFLFEKFAGRRSLIGTPDDCARLVDQLAGIGVDEVACLLDFGPDPDAILGSLGHLANLAARSAGG